MVFVFGECFSATLRAFKRFFVTSKNISCRKLGLSACLVCLNHLVAVSLFLPLIQKLLCVALYAYLIWNNKQILLAHSFTVFICRDFRLILKFHLCFLGLIKQIPSPFISIRLLMTLSLKSLHYFSLLFSWSCYLVFLYLVIIQFYSSFWFMS